MKEHHLYKIENKEPLFEYYLYVIQKIECTDSMDILAIRSDFIRGIFPLYSPAISYEKDFGHPTINTLIAIDSNFYHAIKTAIIMLDFKETLQRYSNVKSFLKNQISELCSNNIHNICNGEPLSTNVINYHLISAAINRKLGIRETKEYVQNKIHTQTNNP